MKRSGGPDPLEGIECCAFPYKLSLRWSPLSFFMGWCE